MMDSRDQSYEIPSYDVSRKVQEFTGKATTKRGKKLQILRARGVFYYLPVLFSNDLVHGAWWYVLGSVGGLVLAIIPLIDIYSNIFGVTEGTSLQLFSQSATWILLILSCFFYTVGSVIFVRAFEDPRPPPLLPHYKHFRTDELLASWTFFFAAVPAIPYSLFYIHSEPHNKTYWALLMASFMLIGVNIYFVYVCYPSHHHLVVRICLNLLFFIFKLA